MSRPVLIDAAGVEHGVALPDARIVCLVPSITELLCDLGLTRQLVGRTGFCIHPRAVVSAISKVGGTKDVKIGRIRELAPTHVIVNIDENRRETAQELAEFVPSVIVTHPCSPGDNASLYRLLGGVFRRDHEAERLCTALTAELDATANVTWPERRVLYLIWRDPWMTVSPDTYVSRTLGLVNWQTVPTECAARYPTIDLQAVAADVEIVLLSSEPYRFRTSHIAEVADAAPHASVRLIDGEMTSWYGSRAIEGIRYVRDLASAYDGSG